MPSPRKKPARGVAKCPPPRTRVVRGADGELTWRGEEESLSARELIKYRARRHVEWVRARALAALCWMHGSSVLLCAAAGVGVLAGGLSEDFALRALGITVGGSLGALYLVLRWAYRGR